MKQILKPAVLALALGLSALSQAQTPAAPAAPAAPTAKQLAALCDGCAIVTATKSEKRKGKATAVGTAGGAVVGGVVGNKVGDGGVLATGVGAVAGAALGREIEKQVKRHRVWITTVTQRDGKTLTVEASADPGIKVGEVVRVEGDKVVKIAAASPAK